MSVAELVIEHFDQKEHSLDKYMDDIQYVTPTIDTEPEKVLEFLKSKSIEDVKKYEEKFLRNLVYAKAITQGEVELDNFPYLWRKYR